MTAFGKDIARSIRGSLKRFVSIAVITALGATMLTGLSMACIDLRAAADALYTRQNLFDIYVQSTYGLTDEDIAELAQVDGVELAEGGFEQDTYTHVGKTRATVSVKALLASGVNEPYVVEGRLPEAADEVAVTESYLHASGKRVGDSLSFEDPEREDPTGLEDLSDDGDEEDPIIPGGTYTIVGTVIDPANITQPDGPVAFRASTSSDYTLFVSGEAVQDRSSYTVAYLSVSGTEGLSAYSDAYTARIDEVRERVEDLAPQRERARTDEIRDDALEGIAEGEAEANEQLADAERELDEAQATLDESLAEALAGARELDAQEADARSQLDDAQEAIDLNRALMESGAAELAEGRLELAEGIRAYNEALPAAEQELRDGQAALDGARDDFYATTVADLEAQRDELQGVVDTLPGQIALMDDQVAQIASGLKALAEAPELAVLPGGGELASELPALAGRISDAWAAVTAVDPADTGSASEAAGEFAQAIDETAGALSPIKPALAAAVQQADGRIAKVEETLTGAEEDLALATEAAEAAAAEEARIRAELDALPDDDPGRPALEQQLAQAAELAESAAGNRDNAQTTVETLASERDALSARRDQLAAYQRGIEAIIDLADDENPKNAAALAGQRIEAAAGLAQATEGLTQIEAGIQTAIDTAETEFAAQQAAIDAGWRKLYDAYDKLVQAQAVLDENERQLDAGISELAAGQAELDRRRADALTQIAEARSQLEDGLAQIADGQAELDEGRSTLEKERADAEREIADARARVDGVDLATWYVQDRSALGSFSSVDSDASSIEAIARIIPVIFFVVAILVSLTTATRMVEEERELIGLYKALGYSKRRILSKYLVYTVSAALIGGIVGDVAGFVVLPYILFYIFQAMYLLPLFSLQFSAFYAVVAVALFVIGIGGSTFLTCRADLRETPAALMRPKAPRAGSRIFLERIRPLWRRMGFLNKVTARNLFRYKKRMLMTIFGIMGCTALLICGFAIKNTVESLAPRQYEQVYRYDLMAATTPDDYGACLAALEATGEVTGIEGIGVDNITVEFDGTKESMQLYVIPSGASITPYVTLETLDGESIDLDEAGVVITNNAATVLGLGAGDTVDMTASDLTEAEVPVAAVTRNYLGNAVYMTQDAYEELFGELELNGFFAHLSGTDEEQRALADELEADEAFLSITSVAKMREQFEQSFTLINVVVYVVIGLAAGLAFVVLFTLSTVNIGEREREIATIKVLGFRKREVRTYINKETLILTLLGILVGLPAGWALSESFTYILKMPSIFFDVVVDPWCYALAAAFSCVFAVAVSLITNRMLDRIVMVDALKSPE